MATIQEQLEQEQKNPAQTDAQDRMDDLSADWDEWLINRKNTLGNPEIHKEYIDYTGTFLETPEMGIGREFGRPLEKTDVGKAVSTGISLGGKGLSAVNEIFRRAGIVAQSSPTIQYGLKQFGLATENFNAALSRLCLAKK